MASEERHCCKSCDHYWPHDGSIDTDLGQCFVTQHIADVKCTDTCPYWHGEDLQRHSVERVRLETDVVQAALAERRAGLHMRATMAMHAADDAAVKAWNKALDANYAAVDALLAFLGEGKDA